MDFLSILHNDLILTGSVDCYCLVCDNYLRSEDEAFSHMDKPIHKKNMEMAVIVEKFVNDRIVKVKKGYYCPFCNILLSTITKVSIHIGDTHHQENKRNQMITRLGKHIIAFDEVVIKPDSWHGLMDNTCVVCNVEFGDDDMHRKELGHILKLIQSRYEFGDKYVYRKVDEDSFFCLICGSLYAINEKLNHHENNSHKDLYNCGKELKNKIPLSTQVETTNVPYVVPKSENANIPIAVNHKQPKGKKTKKKDTKIIKKVEPKNTDKVEIKETEDADIKQTVFVNAKNDFKAKYSLDSYETLTRNIAHNKDSQLQESLPQEQKGSTLVSKIPENVAYAANMHDEKSEKKAPTTMKANTREEEKPKSDVLDRVEEFQKKGINIDFTWDRARCRHCDVNIPFDTAAIEKHVEQHNVKPKTDIVNVPKTDVNKQPKKPDSINEKLPQVKAKRKVDKKKGKVSKNVETEKLPKKLDNAIEKLPKKVDNANERLPKKVINTKETLPNQVDNANEKPLKKLDIEAMEAHVTSPSHKEKVSQKSESTLGKKVPSKKYLKTLVKVELSGLGVDIILNEKYLLRQNSLHCIITEEESYNCILCNMYFSKSGEQLNQHVSKTEHKDKLFLSKILTTLPDEFIREVNPDLYHCGYCNEVFTWPEMQQHLLKSRHIEANRHARWNLERCQTLMKNVQYSQVSSSNMDTMLDYTTCYKML